MRSVTRFALGAVLLLGIVAYAGQRQKKDSTTLDRVGGVERALRQAHEKPGIHVLFFEGPGALIQRADGVFFSPGDEPLPLIMGFPVDWDQHRLLAGPPGVTIPENETPVEITGWLSIAYDPQTGLLDMSLTDDTGQAFQQVYQPAARVQADATAFAEFVDEFFQFMNTNPDVIATAGGSNCVCRCTFAGGGCTATLEICGNNCSSCDCSCSMPSKTCKCTCVQTPAE